MNNLLWVRLPGRQTADVTYIHAFAAAQTSGDLREVPQNLLMPSSSSDSFSVPALFSKALYHDPAPVGGVAVALLAGTYGLFGLSPDLPLLVAGFCGTTLLYAADRAWTETPEDRINRPERVAWVQAHARWLAVESAGLVALGGAMLPLLEWWTLVWTGILGSVAGLHLLPRGTKRPVLTGLPKPVVIAGTWAAGGVLLPLVEAGEPIGSGALLFFGDRWLFLLPNLLLADWGDREGDAEAGLAPWATSWSARQVRGSATALLLGAAAGSLVWAVSGTVPILAGVDAVGPVLMMGAVWGLDPTRPRDAFLFDLVVAWPLIPALLAWMIV
jgi:4-hydroxybenzoate polyprenyltransferase